MDSDERAAYEARIDALQKTLELYQFTLLRIKSNLEMLGKELSPPRPAP